MTKSTLFIKGQGIGYTRVFDSVAVGLCSNCGLLLGKIAGFCEMTDNSCLKSQDELAFLIGTSIKTAERTLNILTSENLIIDHTKIAGIPHKYSLNEKKIREFDKKYETARRLFLDLEQEIIKGSTTEVRKKYVSEKGIFPKIFRRYINLYYRENEWHVKITHIKNIDVVLSNEKKLADPEKIRKMLSEMRSEMNGKNEDANN